MEKLNPVDAFFKHLGDRLARDLLSVGDEPGHPSHRMEYKSTLTDGSERGQGGMGEDALAKFFATQLRQYFKS